MDKVTAEYPECRLVAGDAAAFAAARRRFEAQPDVAAYRKVDGGSCGRACVAIFAVQIIFVVRFVTSNTTCDYRII